MAWTQDDLTKIEAAIAEGALEVEYKDKRVKYQSARDLRKTRELIRRDLGLNKRTVRVKAEFNKGL